MEQERRKYKRYDTDAKIYFTVNYEVNTKLEFQVVDRRNGTVESQKHPAVGRNISAAGMGFSSAKALAKGDILHLEVFIPGKTEQIQMIGEVRWSQENKKTRKPEEKFDTGIQLISVNGKAVADSIFFDETHKVIWSNVLESVLGSFRVLEQKRRGI